MGRETRYNKIKSIRSRCFFFFLFLIDYGNNASLIGPANYTHVDNLFRGNACVSLQSLNLSFNLDSYYR